MKNVLLIDFYNYVLYVLHSKKICVNSRIDFDRWKSSVVKNLALYVKKFSPDQVCVVLDDSGRSWKKEIYPGYKKNKKNTLSKYSNYADFRSELDDLTRVMGRNGYKVVSVSGCEADDIIATIALNCDSSYTIFSSDSDYLQLVHLENVSVYNFRIKDFVTHGEAINSSTMKKIICGQSKLNVPSVLTPLDDSEVSQITDEDWLSILDKGLEYFLFKNRSRVAYKDPTVVSTKLYRFSKNNIFDRIVANAMLIDFYSIPSCISKRILACI